MNLLGNFICKCMSYHEGILSIYRVLIFLLGNLNILIKFENFIKLHALTFLLDIIQNLLHQNLHLLPNHVSSPQLIFVMIVIGLSSLSVYVFLVLIQLFSSEKPCKGYPFLLFMRFVIEID